jgi:hypothetical protein
MHSRLATCVVLVVGCILLAIPTKPSQPGNQDQPHIVAFALGQTSSALPDAAFDHSAVKCNNVGYPCGFHGYACCPGLVCVDRGGSTRAGYQCRPRSESGSTGSFQDKLSANRLDDDALAELLR